MISKPKKIKQINPNHDDRTDFTKLKKDLLKLGIVLDTDGVVYLMYFQDDIKNTKKHHHFLNFEKDRYTFQEIFEIGKRMADQKSRQNPNLTSKKFDNELKNLLLDKVTIISRGWNTLKGILRKENSLYWIYDPILDERVDFGSKQVSSIDGNMIRLKSNAMKNSIIDQSFDLQKRQNPKPKLKKKVKKVTKKKSAKKIKRIVITGRQPSFKRIAGENAVGGLGVGFGVSMGHSFGDWLFD